MPSSDKQKLQTHFVDLNDTNKRGNDQEKLTLNWNKLTVPLSIEITSIFFFTSILIFENWRSFWAFRCLPCFISIIYQYSPGPTLRTWYWIFSKAPSFTLYCLRARKEALWFWSSNPSVVYSWSPFSGKKPTTVYKRIFLCVTALHYASFTFSRNWIGKRGWCEECNFRYLLSLKMKHLKTFHMLLFFSTSLG